ncbi:hypothetical protein [Georgenia sp. TF02-10]|nr:hypothetical protein [Georgenia sp. TF02-10]
MTNDQPTEVDVFIIGGGISGIGATYRLQEMCPDLPYLVETGNVA